MNIQGWPTNITDFRLAIEHVINYTALLYTYYLPLLNVALAKLYLGLIHTTNPSAYNPNLAINKYRGVIQLSLISLTIPQHRGFCR